jgi:hypothetical protein
MADFGWARFFIFMRSRASFIVPLLNYLFCFKF